MNSLIIVDFEATCCDKNEFPRQQMEIIEIGACSLDENFKILDEFQSFIHPMRNPKLTKFCTTLTTITQSMIDEAEGFPDILKKFKKWIWSFENPIFCSWGGYDKNQLLQDCEYHSLPFPFSGEHRNLKIENLLFLL